MFTPLVFFVVRKDNPKDDPDDGKDIWDFETEVTDFWVNF
jgi:hypothetical protein